MWDESPPDIPNPCPSHLQRLQALHHLQNQGLPLSLGLIITNQGDHQNIRGHILITLRHHWQHLVPERAYWFSPFNLGPCNKAQVLPPGWLCSVLTCLKKKLWSHIRIHSCPTSKLHPETKQTERTATSKCIVIVVVDAHMLSICGKASCPPSLSLLYHTPKLLLKQSQCRMNVFQTSNLGSLYCVAS